MVSRFQATGWINTGKPSKPSARTLKGTRPTLHQTSMHEFLRRKPKSKLQKENMQMIAPSRSRKREIHETKDCSPMDIAIKRQKTVEGHTQGPKLGLGPPTARKPSPQRQDSKDCFSSLFGVVDGRGVTSDVTAVPDSPTTLRVDPRSAVPQWQTERKDGDHDFSEDISESSQAFTSPPINLLSVDLAPERRISSDDLPRGPSGEFPNMTPHASPSPDNEWFSVPHPDMKFLIPSSQTLDTRFRFPPIPTGPISHSADQVPIGTPHDDSIVPSSQSQYILPYNASPPPPSPVCDSGEHFMLNRTEIIPSSQSQLEMDLQIPTPYPRGDFSMTEDDAVDPSVASVAGERTLDLASPRNFFFKRSVTTPVKTLSREREEPASVAAQSCNRRPTIGPSSSLCHSPPHQHETLSFLLSATSPLRLSSRQCTYTSCAESFPLEVTDFLDLFDEDRRSLGPEFLGSNFGLSAQSEQDVCVDESRRGCNVERALPGKTFNFEPPCLYSQSIGDSSIYTPIGHESEYTFVDESYPPDVIDFLDGLEQDRGSLGSEFQESI